MVDSLQKRVYLIAANVWIYQDPHTKELFGVCVGGFPFLPVSWDMLFSPAFTAILFLQSCGLAHVPYLLQWGLQGPLVRLFLNLV